MLRRYLSAAAILLIAALALVIWLQPRPTPVKFDLPDGTSVTLGTISYGKSLRFYEGKPWQRILYFISPKRIPQRWRGYEITVPSKTGGIGIELKHFVMRNGTGSLPLNSFEHLVLVNADGSEVAGNRRLVNFDVNPYGLDGRQPTIEDIIWEFPISSNRDLHFRLYISDLTPFKAATNEFTIPNPAFK